nr:AAA family ATPase [Armatimonas rosea]
MSQRTASFTDAARQYGLPEPKGVLLLGVQGCGKSLTAKAIGSLWKLPLLRLDVGKIFGGIVGQSEENIRKAISTAESVAPCVLWIDELEKGFSGTQSSGSSDGGTTSRVFGTFLAWMQDKKAPVFVIATSNDVTALPAELLRKGRFDEIFFVDLPSKAERKEIFDIHLKKRGRDPKNFNTEELGRVSVGFSGAEIEQAVVSALFSAFADSKKDAKTGEETIREVTVDDLKRSIKISVPLSVTMQESIDHLRNWADERARPVSSVQAESAQEILDADDDEDDAPYRMDNLDDDESH